jgi:hypothetical protein
MDTLIWKAWPWLSLVIFSVLVRKVLRPPHWPWPNPYSPIESPANDHTGTLLVLSIIVGAAICVLLQFGLKNL